MRVRVSPRALTGWSPIRSVNCIPSNQLPAVSLWDAISTVSSARYVDLQVNGFAGVDFQEPGLGLREMTHAIRELRRHRTGRILLTLITDRVDALCSKLRSLERLRRRSKVVEEVVAGYHLEGPYLLSRAGFSGAHDARLMKSPRLRELDNLWDASGGNIRLVTLAPELPGAPEFIQHAASLGIRTAIGHSDAGERAIDEAIRAGLSLCTHLGNGVPQRLHRHDNIVQRLLGRDELYAAFIPDRIHLPDFVLRNFVRAKPVERVLFTTDCMAAAGAPPGRYRLGRLETEVGADGVVRQPGEPRYFAGSSLTMDAAARNVQEILGWSRAKAEAACSSRVARYLGLPD
jgi:N-acetylglucosamine-6-phosphate deacetylase